MFQRDPGITLTIRDYKNDEVEQARQTAEQMTTEELEEAVGHISLRSNRKKGWQMIKVSVEKDEEKIGFLIDEAGNTPLEERLLNKIKAVLFVLQNPGIKYPGARQGSTWTFKAKGDDLNINVQGTDWADDFTIAHDVIERMFQATKL